jgi:hypothetical protein
MGSAYGDPQERPEEVDERLAAALLRWFDRTHGNGFGHDHHCPVRDDSDPDPRCTCGWSGVVLANLARDLPLHNRTGEGL